MVYYAIHGVLRARSRIQSVRRRQREASGRILLGRAIGAHAVIHPSRAIISPLWLAPATSQRAYRLGRAVRIVASFDRLVPIGQSDIAFASTSTGPHQEAQQHADC